MRAQFLNLRHLRAFLAVHAHGSITSAMDHVHMSQPAITHAIAKLEATIGAVLFQRGPSGMSPSAAGVSFARRTDRALNLLRTGCQAASRGETSRDSPFDQTITSTQLRALLAVAAAGSFSVAARNLGIAQPSLYRVARDLEKISGLRLFELTRTGIALTPPAHTLSRASKLAFAELNQGLEEASFNAGSISATVVVGSLPLARSYLLPTAISKLTERQPDVAIKVVDGPFSDLLHALRDGEIDLMVGALRDPLPAEDVVQELLFQDSLGIYCGPDHPLADCNEVPLSELSAYPWIVPKVGTPTRAFFDQFMQKNALVPPSGLIESSSMILIRGVLNTSHRLTIISHRQVREDALRGSLVALPFTFQDAGRGIGLTHRKAWSPTLTQALFLRSIRETAQAMQTH
ncbi:MAG: LysR family transcriptional regulator [Cognatishimia sp.]